MLDQLLIVGAGDVVANRMLPALAAAGIARRATIIHDGICEVTDASGLDIEIVEIPRRAEGKIEAIQRIAAATAAPVIVATPPQPRLDIALACRSLGLPIVLEKPLYTTLVDRDRFGALLARDPHVYGLSYYVQEKALAWAYLNAIDEADEPYLVANGAPATAKSLFRNLGRLERLSIVLREGAERSGHPGRTTWYASAPHGVLFDLGVHVLSMIAIASARGLARDGTALDLQQGDAAGQYRLRGFLGPLWLKSEFGKSYPAARCRRTLDATYAHGRVKCSFDDGSLQIIHNDGRSAGLALRHSDLRYRTLAERLRPFLRQGRWQKPRPDWLSEQQIALEVLLALSAAS